MKHGLRSSCLRWRDIGLLSVTGAATAAILSPRLLPAFVPAIWSKGLAIPVATLLALLFFHYGWSRRRAWFGVRNLVRYPPAWLVALPGFALLLLL